MQAPPSINASAFPVGACLHGKDGKLYQVNTTSRSVRRWLPCGTSADTMNHLLMPVRLSFPVSESERSSRPCNACGVASAPPSVEAMRDVRAAVRPLPYHDVHVTWDLEQCAYIVQCYVQANDLGAVGQSTSASLSGVTGMSSMGSESSFLTTRPPFFRVEGAARGGGVDANQRSFTTSGIL